MSELEKKELSPELREELKSADPVTLLYHAMLRMGSAMAEMNAKDMNINADVTYQKERFNVSVDLTLGEPKESN